MDPETRGRKEKIAHEIGFSTNRAAQHLRTGRSGMLALASSMLFSVAAGSKPTCGVAAAGLQRFPSWSPPQYDASQPKRDLHIRRSDCFAAGAKHFGQFPKPAIQQVVAAPADATLHTK
ncbi:hypothetical protein [Phaeobacter piscinae]|uniref:hypothetical protein n=1 Tax=Phaeobacter piscinae TaxID=1580596 RepID=UPI000F4C28F2|nr:hypothetical protein [Phaeobacter piscinae]